MFQTSISSFRTRLASC